MSRLYEMTVEISGSDRRKQKLIIDACCENWSFEEEVFHYAPITSALIASAQNYLCGGETEREFADRLTKAIWKANDAYCRVEVSATYLEDQPCEHYVYDESKYNDTRLGGPGLGR